MNAGFALIETGFCRAKNVVNIMGKNFVVFVIASIAYWVGGFAFMFGDGNAVIGLTGFFVGETSGPFSALWLPIKITVGLRVHPEDELIGLDISEMGMEAYPHDSVAASPG
jgi:ammonia channel protein AmtB